MERDGHGDTEKKGEREKVEKIQLSIMRSRGVIIIRTQTHFMIRAVIERRLGDGSGQQTFYTKPNQQSLLAHCLHS